MPSDRQRDYVDAVREWERQHAEGGWRVDKRDEGWRVEERAEGVLRTTVRELTPEEREALTVPAGSFDHYRQDPSDPATIGLEALLARVAEGRVSPADASAIVRQRLAVAKRGWEAFYGLIAAHLTIAALNVNNPWIVRLLMAGAVCASVARAYRIRQSRRSLEK